MYSVNPLGVVEMIDVNGKMVRGTLVKKEKNLKKVHFIALIYMDNFCIFFMKKLESRGEE